METDTFHFNHSSTDVKALQEELEQLNSDLSEASEQRAQAAEYGLVLLEEKQALQSQYEELGVLYETTKKELENSTNVRAWGGGGKDQGGRNQGGRNWESRGKESGGQREK